MKTTVPKALLLLVVVLSVTAIVSAAPAEEGESLKRSQQDKEHDDLPLDAADVNDDQLIEVNDKRSTVARRERVSKHLKRRRKADTDIDNDDDNVDDDALALLDGTARDGSDDDLSLTQTKSKGGRWWWSYRRRRWWSYRRRRWWYRRRRWWYRRRRWWYRRRRWWYRRRRWVYRRRRWVYRRRRWVYRRRRYVYRRRRYVYRRRRYVYRRRRWVYRRRRATNYYQAPGTAVTIPQPKRFIPVKGVLRAPSHRFPHYSAYAWTFWVKPLSVRHTKNYWSNIFHRGNYDSHRNAAVWFYPGSARLHIRSGDSASWNSGYDPADLLPLFTWTHVGINHGSGIGLEVYYNGVKKGTLSSSGPTYRVGHLYTSNPWYDAAHVMVSDLRMYTHTINVATVYKQRKYIVKKKSLLKRVKSFVSIPQPKTYFIPVQSQVRAPASLIPNKHKYTWTVWIKPLSARGTGHGWANLFHKGSTNSERNPAVWFYPGSHRLHIRSGTSATWNDGSDPTEQLPLKKWTHLAFSHGFSSLKVYYNGHMKSTYATTHPLTNNGPLYTSDPWYPAGHALLSQLRMYSIELSAKEVKYVYTNTKKRNYAQAAGKWCGCKNVYRNFNTQQWHNCPSGTLMTGVYRTSTDYLNGIQYYRCCSPCNGNGKKMKVSVCSVANWWSSFDSTGWSKCPKNMYMQGVYKNWCNWIYCLEMARCCYIDGSKGSRSCTTKSSWASSLDSAGWSYLDKNKFMTGLYRSAQHYLHNIEYASQCAFKAPVKKKVVVTPTAATAVVVTKKGSSKYHKGWLDGWKAGWKDGTINHSQ